MKRLVILPDGWPCTLAECPPGLFLFQERTLGLKTDYSDDQPYVVDSGEVFWGGVGTPEDREELIVQPCAWGWVND